MYYLFSHHHVLPSVYAALGEGEKLLLRAFARQEIAERSG